MNVIVKFFKWVLSLFNKPQRGVSIDSNTEISKTRKKEKFVHKMSIYEYLRFKGYKHTSKHYPQINKPEF